MVHASAIFDTHAEAERAVSELRTAGVNDTDLSIIAHHGGTTTATSGEGEITDEHHRNVLRGILGGGALGAGLGVAALAIPGVGPLAAAGAIAASAVPEAMAIGAGLGALTGTFNEVLTKHGVSEDDANYYGGRMKDGGVVVTVGGSGIDGDRAREILYRNGGHNSTQARASAY
ncbi:general stress protein [Sphingomonas sp. MJ1 (PH-R8)]|uniref:general stress protein n=1 Tax=unclassified Sphingomonas TaxID=196159 RepID=UPI001EF73DA6|nr:general stress protein [Sphingomonas sp. ACRSK]MCG7349996.1 general stress protein [Sphingomonas sp. ACRSK]